MQSFWIIFCRKRMVCQTIQRWCTDASPRVSPTFQNKNSQMNFKNCQEKFSLILKLVVTCLVDAEELESMGNKRLTDITSSKSLSCNVIFKLKGTRISVFPFESHSTVQRYHYWENVLDLQIAYIFQLDNLANRSCQNMVRFLSNVSRFYFITHKRSFKL